jgi:hypothetical protein
VYFFGVRLYDYGARFYDPQIGRWMVIDPMAEIYISTSPYIFSGNNPVKFVDLNGMDYDVYYNGKYQFTNKTQGKKDENSKPPVPDIPQTFTDLANKLAQQAKDYFHWGLDPSNPANANEIKEGAERAEQAAKAINEVNKFIIYNGALFVLTEGGEALLVTGVGRAITMIRLASADAKVITEAAKTGVQANRIAGNAFRDEIAARLIAEGRKAITEVYKVTPFGARYIDIEVSMGGKVLGGIETKVGSSQYNALQRIKDIWLDLNTPGGYPVQLIRKP